MSGKNTPLSVVEQGRSKGILCALCALAERPAFALKASRKGAKALRILLFATQRRLPRRWKGRSRSTEASPMPARDAAAESRKERPVLCRRRLQPALFARAACPRQAASLTAARSPLHNARSRERSVADVGRKRELLMKYAGVWPADSRRTGVYYRRRARRIDPGQ